MNIQEIDKWLDNEYGVSYTGLEELHNWLCDREIEKDEEIERLHSIIKEVRECIEHYAIENDDFSKFYNNEEIEILKIIGSDKE